MATIFPEEDKDKVILPFVDREAESRLICHPKLGDLRHGDKACCVVVAKKPGAGKTYLGKCCLEMARQSPPEPYSQKEWDALLPVLTLYCEPPVESALPEVLGAIADYAKRRLNEVKDGTRGISSRNSCEVVPMEESIATRTQESMALESWDLSFTAVMDIIDGLKLQLISNLSDETRDRFDDIANRLKRGLVKQPLSNWPNIVYDIVGDSLDTDMICEWLKREAAAKRRETAAQRREQAMVVLRQALDAPIRELAVACFRWKNHFKDSEVEGKKVTRPVALLIVIDEAQRVLPGRSWLFHGKEVDDLYNMMREHRAILKEENARLGRQSEAISDRVKRLQEELDEMEEEVRRARVDIRMVFCDMQPAFLAARFLWTGVSSAAVDLQMRRGDRGADIRIISIALPPLDVAQWTLALEQVPPGQALSGMQRIVQKSEGMLTSLEVEDDTVEVNDDVAEVEGGTFGVKDIADWLTDPNLKSLILMELMRSTGGWPREVLRYVGNPDIEEDIGEDMKQNDWVDAVFWDSKPRGNLEAATLTLLDQVYLEPGKSVLEHVRATEFCGSLESGRAFYELLHTSGLQLVLQDQKTPAIYVPDCNDEVLKGVTITQNLGESRLRHTTGSLQLQARLRPQTRLAQIHRGVRERFTTDGAEEATVGMLSYLNEYSGYKLKEVLPWLEGSGIADVTLKSEGLLAVAGLAVRPNGTVPHELVPSELERHYGVGNLIKPKQFQTWLENWWKNTETHAPYIYVFGARSKAGDILVLLRDLHIHIQVKNAARKPDWKEEYEKMVNVSYRGVTNVYVLINYYDNAKKQRRPFVEISMERTATMCGGILLPGDDDLTDWFEFPDLCPVVNLRNLWEQRHVKKVVAESCGMQRQCEKSNTLGDQQPNKARRVV